MSSIMDKEDNKYKIALLILATSKDRNNWSNIKDTYLYNMTLKTFLYTHNTEFNYILYIGIDSGDRIFDDTNQQEEILRFSKAFPHIEFCFIVIKNINKGHVTKMWNILFKEAYNIKCDYFYQCGDDIEFKTKNWIKDSILKLKEHNDIGLTGPINNNNRILTQAFVSRKHMEIFGWFFPEQIKNWCCDDWYNMVYYPKYLYPLHNHLGVNNGGPPRYDIHNMKNFKGSNNQTFAANVYKLREQTQTIANQHKKLIEKYISNN